MREMFDGACRVFGKPWYMFLAFAVSGAVFVSITALSEYQNILTTASSQLFDPWTKTRLIVVYATTPQIMFDGLTIVAVTSLSALFGVNLSLNVFAYRQAGRTGNQATGMLGLVAGTVGVGCSACGSVILSSVFTTTAAGSVLAFLPLRGKEF